MYFLAFPCLAAALPNVFTCCGFLPGDINAGEIIFLRKELNPLSCVWLGKGTRKRSPFFADASLMSSLSLINSNRAHTSNARQCITKRESEDRILC